MSETILTPPDPNRCQCEVTTTDGPFVLGGGRHTKRCEAKPDWIVHETAPGEDGLCGAMSLCDAHRAVFLAQTPDTLGYRFEPILDQEPPATDQDLELDPVEQAHLHEQAASQTLNHYFAELSEDPWTDEDETEIRNAVSSIVMAAIFQGKAALAEIAAELGRDQKAEDPRPIFPNELCPACGGFSWDLLETRIVRYRTVRMVAHATEGYQLEVSRRDGRDGAAAGINHHLQCSACGAEYPLDDDVSIDWG